MTNLNYLQQLLIFRYCTKVFVSGFQFENAINIDFSKAKANLQRIWRESLDLAYKLVDLKIKSKAPDQIYFMSQVFQEHCHCYDKRNK